MIVNFHPTEIPSKKVLEVIGKLNSNNEHTVFHVNDKTAEEWQTIISSDEKLVFVAPVFWWGLGYEFDKWIQYTFAYGFAYKYTDAGMPEGLLHDRAFEVHLTHGTPMAFAGTLQENLKTRLVNGVFGFCNSKLDLHLHDMQS